MRSRLVHQITGGIDEFVRAGWREITPAEFMRAVAADNFDETGGHFLVEQLFASALAASSSTIADDLATFYRDVTKGYTESYARLIEFLASHP